MEGVFSSSKYASSIQNVQERTSQSRPPTIYKSLQGTSRWPPSLGRKRGHRKLPSDHRTLDPQRPVLMGWPRVLLNLACQSLTATCKAPDALHVHTGLKLRKVCKTSGSPDAEHRTLSGASGAHWTHTQRSLQNARTPDAEHRTLSDASGALCYTRQHTGR